MDTENVTDLGACATGCGRTLVPDRQWKQLTRVQRDQLRAERRASRHVCRMLCVACYQRLRKSGDQIDYERTTVPRMDVLEEWDRMDKHGMSLRQAARILAPRLGMTEQALEKAVHRSGRRSLHCPATSWKRAA